MAQTEENKPVEPITLARIPTSLGSQNQNPVSVPDGKGGSWVIWQSFRQGVANANLYIQRIGIDGKRKLANDGVPISHSKAHQNYPKIVADENGGIHVVWLETYFKQGDEKLFYLHLNGAAIPTGLPTRICSQESRQNNFSACALPNGRVAIAWQDDRNEETDTDIFAQCLDSTGKVLWKPEGTKVCTAAEKQINPNLCASESGYVVCVWEDRRDGMVRQLFAQRINPQGQVLWDIDGILLAKRQNVNFKNPCLLSDGYGGFICAFEVLGSKTLQKDIFLVRINRVGLLLYQRTVAEFNYDQYNPMLIPADENSFLIAWQDTRDIGVDLFVKRYSTVSGNQLWVGDGLQLCANFADKQRPKIVPIENGRRFIAAWEDNRKDGCDIFGQLFTIEGDLLWGKEGTAITVQAGIQKQLELCSVNHSAVAYWLNETDKYSSYPSYQIINPEAKLMYGLYGTNLLEEQEVAYARLDFPIVQAGYNADIFVAWEDYRNGKKNSDIYIQRLNAYGMPIWRSGGVPICTAENYQSLPTIQTVPGGAYIAWIDRRNNDDDLYLQFIDTLGRIRWQANGIPVCNVPRTQNDIMFARAVFPHEGDSLESGVYLTWTDARNFYTTGFDIYLQRIEANGKPAWTANGILAAKDSTYQSAPSICEDGFGGVYVAWADEREGNYNIYAQHFDYLGGKLFPEGGVPLGKCKGHQRYPTLKRDPITNTVYALWADDRLGFQNTMVMLQGLTPRGELLFKPNGKAICTFKSRQSSPDLLLDYRNGLVVTWLDQRNAIRSDYNLYTQRLTKEGEPIWNLHGVQLGEYLRENNPFQVILGPLDNLFYTWRQSIGTSKQKVFLAEVSLHNGTILNKFVPTTEDSEQIASSLAINASGKATLVWVEKIGEVYQLMLKIF